MEYFKSLTVSNLVELIVNTKKCLYLSLPSIHSEIENAITYLNYSNSYEENEIKIHLLLDFDAQTFRQGYGNFQSVEDLINGGFEIKCLKDNRISFVISDDIAYYLFIESRSMIPADKQTINAVKIDPVSIVRLKNYFFPKSQNSDYKDELTNAIIEESKSLSEPSSLIADTPATIREISNYEIDKIRGNLKQNPVLNPDYKRIVDFYQNKFQYAELHYYGQRIEHYTVSIPPNLLPYKNEELKNKLLTRLKLFENIGKNESFQKFKSIERRKNEIIDKYLTPLKCRKNRSVLKIGEKSQFVEEINKLTEDLAKIKTTIYTAMIDELESAKDNLQTTFQKFLLENPIPEMIEMGKDNFPVMAKSISNHLVTEINVDPAKMISKIKMECHFADITFEDLNDVAILKEFSEKELIDKADINHLADFSKGVKV